MSQDPALVVRRFTGDDLADVLALFEVVAAEGRFIGMEAPLDVDRLTTVRHDDLTNPDALRLVATVGAALVGELSLHVARGRADLGMLLGPDHRGRGIGSALLGQALEWARGRPDVHKVTLQVWPHNVAAQALYRKFGFIVEGYLHRHWRRANGELWDAMVMGLLL